jgi:hypothetical protein
MLASVSTLLLLTACGPSGSVKTSVSLPPVPADIQVCFNGSAVVDVPRRALTRADVESLWKKDRIRNVVLRNCGNRFLAWYGDLR